jgi:hypothetical protein
VAGTLGLMLGVFCAFLLDYMGAEGDLRYLWAQVTSARGKAQPEPPAEVVERAEES